MGHDVTLYASGDSVTAARLVPVVPQQPAADPRRPDWMVWHTIMLDRCSRRRPDYDVIHFHIDVLHLPLARRCATPLPDHAARPARPARPAAAVPAFQRPSAGVDLRHQRKPLPWANWRATVHHGLPRDLYTLSCRAAATTSRSSAASRRKSASTARSRSRIACGMPLRIAAKVDEADRAYFESTIKPLLAHPLVEFIGEIDEPARTTSSATRARCCSRSTGPSRSAS